MARRTLLLWVTAIWFFALAVSIVSMVIKDAHWADLYGIAVILGGATGGFIIPGIIPLIWWGTRKFHAVRAFGPMMLWTALAVLLAISTINVSKFEATEMKLPEGATLKRAPG